MNKNVGSRIKSARKKAGLTQLQLAEKIFVSESYIAMIESDKRNPSTDVVGKIADVLNVSVDHLLFGDLPQNEQTMFNQWKKLMNGRSVKEIESAHKLVKLFFENLDSMKSD